MAEYTTNYNLKKPTREDFYNEQDQNGNMDVIDGAMQALSEATPRSFYKVFIAGEWAVVGDAVHLLIPADQHDIRSEQVVATIMYGAVGDLQGGTWAALGTHAIIDAEFNIKLIYPGTTGYAGTVLFVG